MSSSVHSPSSFRIRQDEKGSNAPLRPNFPLRLHSNIPAALKKVCLVGAGENHLYFLACALTCGGRIDFGGAVKRGDRLLTSFPHLSPSERKCFFSAHAPKMGSQSHHSFPHHPSLLIHDIYSSNVVDVHYGDRRNLPK